MPENLRAYFPQRHRTGATHYPVEPAQVGAWTAGGGVGNPIVYGDLHKDPGVDDAGDLDHAKTTYRYAMLTSDFQAFAMGSRHALKVDGEAEVFEIRSAQDHEGITQIRLRRGR